MPQKNEQAKNKTEPREITEELRESYLDYAMSVIVSRALPDVRDGLKPVHRRILWAMWSMNLTPNAKLVKSARVVGEVLGKFHPHGDTAVYDAMVRMAQDFSLRYPLIHGQGNFGSTEDGAAAPRYTEAKLSRISEELLHDIEKETVDWQPNYDNSREEPKYLPAKLPNLVINGTMGIAVGMATNIPPHNLGETIDALNHLIENPDSTIKNLMRFIPAPDFPTGGIIYNQRAIEEAYATGKGSVITRARTEVTELKNGKFQIIITEIPYQVNKADLIIKIAALVQDKKIEGIRDIRDESDRDGLRVVIDLKNDAPPQKILNQLYQYTDLQKNFHFNMIALVDGLQPQVMSIKDILIAHIDHRKLVVKRRTEFDLKKAEERTHILMGLVNALDSIDRVIAAIKKSKDREAAKKNLIKIFKFTEIQANAILDMRLQSLAALERKKLENELKEKKKLITELKLILKYPKKILEIITRELNELKDKFADERRAKIVKTGLEDFSEEDLIKKEEVIITLTRGNYIKRMPPDTFKAQRRGGKGLIGSELKEEDQVGHFISANTHDNILFFTDRGKAFQTKVYEVPTGARTAKGRSIHNFLEIPPEENISAIVSYPDKGAAESTALIMATKNGLIKKTLIKDFANVRRSGIIAINLKEEDELRWVMLSNKKDEVIIVTAKGQSIRFKEQNIRAMGRTAAGVTAIKLKKSDEVVGFDIIRTGESKISSKLLVVMANGYAKQTLAKGYKVQNRGGSGIRTARVTEKTGPIIAARILSAEEEEIIAFSSKGQALRTKIKNIRLSARDTQGVKIMNLKTGDKLMGVVCL